MRLMFACLADHADGSQDGKLNVSGIFDRIACHKFPARHPQMFLALRLIGEFDDNQKKHALQIVLRDADHHESARFEATIETGYLRPGDFGTVNQIIKLNDVVFAKAGRYAFAVTVDDQQEVVVPFEAKAV